MDSNYLNISEIPEALFHPTVRSDEEIFAFKAGYKPNEAISPSLDFSKDEMTKIPYMSWMKDHNFILISPNFSKCTYGTEISVQSNLLGWFKSIEDNCVTFAPEKDELKLVALDLETTGLNTNIRVHGGQITRFETMVGICLAVDEKNGYYIPILHTEEDGVKNWSMEQAKELLDYLTDDTKFILTLHNAVYDFSIIRAHGIKIPKICTDTLVLSKLMNNFEFYQYGIQNGLKQLSEYLLKRKMVDIHEFFGHKSMVQFNLLSATMATVYGGSDAINSISLHHYFVTNDVDGRNPWKYQPLNCVHYNSSITIKRGIESESIEVKIGEAKQYEGWLVDSPDGWVKITRWLDQGIKETIKVEMEDGRFLICTPDHRIETYNRGWVEAQHLTEDDDVITKN